MTVHGSSDPRHVKAIDAPIVSRERELERISPLLDRVGQGLGYCLFIAGEAGIGKTRLTREVLARAQAAGLRGSVGRCFEQFSRVPFFPFSELFATALRQAPSELQTAARSRWAELSYVVPEAGRARKVKTLETQLQVFRAAVDFVRTLAEAGPLLLVLEDLHWADDTSLGLLLHLGRHLHDAPVLLLGTYRDGGMAPQHPLESTLLELRRERLIDEIDLRRLPIAGTKALIQTRLPTQSVSDELLAVVHARAQGNPLFTEEILAAFLEAGLVSSGNADGASGALANMRVPRSIRAVVAERVGRLPTESQDLLTIASVLGQEFELRVLVAVSGRDEAVALRQLDDALQAGLLEDSRAPTGDRYGFNHGLVQEALYEQVPGHRRRRLHLRCGEVLEKVRSERAKVPAALSRHFLQGGDLERAVKYAMQAADDAAKRYAHSEADHHYTLAVRIFRDIGEPARVADAQRRLAGELFDLNRLPEALASFEEALALFERLGDFAGQALVHWGLGRVHQARYDMVATGRHLDTALALWPTDRQDAELARLLHDATRAKTFSAEWDAAKELAERGRALSERLGDADLLARALLGVALAHDQDRLRPMIPVLDQAEALARSAGDWPMLCRIYGNRASYHFSVGNAEQSLADRRHAIEAAERAGEHHRLAFAHQSLADHCLMIGAWGEGRAAARAALTIDPEGLFNYGVGAYVAWMEGRYDLALIGLSARLSDARERHDIQSVTITLTLLADFLLQLDRLSEAEFPAREVAELASARWHSEAGLCLVVRSEILARLGAPDAEESLSDAEHLIDELEQEVVRPQLLRAKGLLLLARGDLSSAIAMFEESAMLARTHHALIELGRTLAVLAEAAGQHGDQALLARVAQERVAVTDAIGPEVLGLPWAGGGLRARGTRRQVRLSDGETRPLTAREREVAELIALGLTDRQIAERLVITEGTAGVHVTHIMNKLGLHTRIEIASWVVQGGLPDAREISVPSGSSAWTIPSPN